MNMVKNFLLQTEKKLDAVEERLKDKELVLPMELLGAGLFLVFSIVILLIMPNQVAVSESDVINGRVFPRLLMIVIILCCAELLVNGLMKKIRHQPIPTSTIHVLTELKALVIFFILLFTYLICKWTNLFVVGSCFCALSFLLYFRCKKWQYYLITIGLAVVIWAAFRFGLGVRF